MVRETDLRLPCQCIAGESCSACWICRSNSRISRGTEITWGGRIFKVEVHVSLRYRWSDLRPYYSELGRVAGEGGSGGRSRGTVKGQTWALG